MIVIGIGTTALVGVGFVLGVDINISTYSYLGGVVTVKTVTTTTIEYLN